jgi:hypothetical protein
LKFDIFGLRRKKRSKELLASLYEGIAKAAHSAFPPAQLLVLLVPVILLTLDSAVGGVPATPVDGLRLTVEALKGRRPGVNVMIILILLQRDMCKKDWSYGS